MTEDMAQICFVNLTDTEQQDIFAKALIKIRQERLSEKTMLMLLTDKTQAGIRTIKLIEILYQSTLTCLQFGQYHRAALYTVALEKYCEKAMSPEGMKTIWEKINKKMMALEEEEIDIGEQR